MGSDSLSDKPTLSINAIGEAPAPPSPPSTVIKSGAESTPRTLTSFRKPSSHLMCPITVLKPTGFLVILRI